MTIDNYNIVCVSDEGYSQHAAVMLCSLFETNKQKHFHIYFLTISLSDVTKQRLNSLCSKYKSTISFYYLSTDELSDLPVGQWNTIMYFKLFMPYVLPKSENRCLFLDVDMIINADINELYNTNLHGKAFAAAEDIPDCIIHKQRLGLSSKDVYINSGVMVCNLTEWRKRYSSDDIFTYTRKISDIIMNEQDVLALYFKNSIEILPIKWNMVTFYFEREPRIFEKYKSELKKARLNPGILHFACPIKPWYKDCQHPYKYLYKKYLLLTEWKDYKFPIFENMTPWGRTKRIMRNLLNSIGFIKDKGFKQIRY